MCRDALNHDRSGLKKLKRRHRERLRFCHFWTYSTGRTLFSQNHFLKFERFGQSNCQNSCPDFSCMRLRHALTHALCHLGNRHNDGAHAFASSWDKPICSRAKALLSADLNTMVLYLGPHWDKPICSSLVGARFIQMATLSAVLNTMVPMPWALAGARHLLVHVSPVFQSKWLLSRQSRRRWFLYLGLKLGQAFW